MEPRRRPQEVKRRRNKWQIPPGEDHSPEYELMCDYEAQLIELNKKIAELEEKNAKKFHGIPKTLCEGKYRWGTIEHLKRFHYFCYFIFPQALQDSFFANKNHEGSFDIIYRTNGKMLAKQLHIHKESARQLIRFYVTCGLFQNKKGLPHPYGGAKVYEYKVGQRVTKAGIPRNNRNMSLSNPQFKAFLEAEYMRIKENPKPI